MIHSKSLVSTQLTWSKCSRTCPCAPDSHCPLQSHTHTGYSWTNSQQSRSLKHKTVNITVKPRPFVLRMTAILTSSKHPSNVCMSLIKAILYDVVDERRAYVKRQVKVTVTGMPFKGCMNEFSHSWCWSGWGKSSEVLLPWKSILSFAWLWFPSATSLLRYTYRSHTFGFTTLSIWNESC